MTNSKLNFTEKAALTAKRMGYKYIASAVKNVFTTTYYNVNSCDDVINAGHWIGAPRSYQYNGQRMGTVDTDIDWGVTITRARLYDIVRKAIK